MDRLASEWDAEWDTVPTPPPVLLLCPKTSPVGPSDVTGHKAFLEPQVKVSVPCCCANQLCTFLSSGYLSSCWLWTGIYLDLLIPGIRKGRARPCTQWHSRLCFKTQQANKLTESGSKKLLQCSLKKKKKRRVLILKIHRVYLQIIQIKGRQLN